MSITITHRHYSKLHIVTWQNLSSGGLHVGLHTLPVSPVLTLNMHALQVTDTI